MWSRARLHLKVWFHDNLKRIYWLVLNFANAIILCLSSSLKNFIGALALAFWLWRFFCFWTVYFREWYSRVHFYHVVLFLGVMKKYCCSLLHHLWAEMLLVRRSRPTYLTASTICRGFWPGVFIESSCNTCGIEFEPKVALLFATLQKFSRGSHTCDDVIFTPHFQFLL